MIGFKFNLKVGKFSGNGSMSRWSKANNERILKETEKRMFRASGFLRTDIRRGMGRRIKARENYKGFHWKSHPPSAAGKPPRKRGRGKQGLQHVTFLQTERFEFRIGSDMFPSGGFGKKTDFKGDVMHMTGGPGQVKLPLELDQMPASMIGLALGQKIQWPMVWKNANYKKRDYLSPSREKVIKQFPQIFGNLNVIQ